MAFKIVTSLAILLLAVGHSRPLEDRQSEGSAEDRSSESLVKDEQEDESQESRASPRGEEEEDSRKGKQPEPVKDTTKESYGKDVAGEYSIHEPAGNVRTVKYHADHHGGFHAAVHNSGGNGHSGEPTATVVRPWTSSSSINRLYRRL